MSSVPLSASAGRASFKVRVSGRHFAVGVCKDLPSKEGHVGRKAFSYSYDNDGDFYHEGARVRHEDSDVYGPGDDIRVQVDFEEKEISFFKNGEIQGKLCKVNLTKPLFACVSLFVEMTAVILL